MPATPPQTPTACRAFPSTPAPAWASASRPPWAPSGWTSPGSCGPTPATPRATSSTFSLDTPSEPAAHRAGPPLRDSPGGGRSGLDPVLFHAVDEDVPGYGQEPRRRGLVPSRLFERAHDG